MGPLPRSPSCLVPMAVLQSESELLPVLLFGFSLSFLLVLTEADSSVIKTFRSGTLPVKFSSVSFLLLRLLAWICEEEGPPVFSQHQGHVATLSLCAPQN